MLCAVCIPDSEMSLLRTAGKVVNSVPSQRSRGVGDSSLLRFLVPLLGDTQANRFTADDALRIGTYLVLKAKAYVDGCGGDTDAMILRPNGHIELHSGETYNIEQHMLGLEHQLRKVTASFFESAQPCDMFTTTANRMLEMMRDEHYQMQVRSCFQKQRT